MGRWEARFIFTGSDSPLTFLLERLQRKKATKACINLVPLGCSCTCTTVVLLVRLIIEVGRFSAVSALAAH